MQSMYFWLWNHVAWSHCEDDRLIREVDVGDRHYRRKLSLGGNRLAAAVWEGSESALLISPTPQLLPIYPLEY